MPFNFLLHAGHGQCNNGFCHCYPGWFGQDCAYRMEGVEYTPGQRRMLLAASHPACLPRFTRALARVGATGDEHTTKPWIAPHVDTPAARDPEPGQARKRPYIYVYELPGKFNSHMLQVCCSTRIFMRCASSLLDCTAR